jgi:hypothetical protein
VATASATWSGVERVGDHRHRAQLGQQRLLRRAARHAVDLVARGNQTRHELPADRSRRTRDEHSHDPLPCLGDAITDKTGRRREL